MNEPIIYPVGNSSVMEYAAQALQWHGMTVVGVPNPDVTHVLLPMPHNIFPKEIAAQLSPHVTVIGGNLNLPGYRCLDLLKDDFYLSQNAMITAHVAITIASQHSPFVLNRCPVLILGWGRIGKCLMKLLQGLGADVTVAVRKPPDRSMIEALGCQSADIHSLSHLLRRYRILFNTVPSPILDGEQCANCRKDCIKIELASQTGIAAADVITARGLPGKYAPESSGRLIAQSILRLLAQEEEIK